MKPNLCVDAGNTRLKAALVHPGTGEVLEHFAPAEEQHGIAGLKEFIAARPARAAILSAVTDDRPALLAVLTDGQIPVKLLDGRLPLPISNAYSTPDTLGADRVALACGGWAAHRGEDVLVVSAGTCITYNLVMRSGTFRGGSISPGIYMRLRAMHHFTDALPEVAINGDTRLLGYDTETSLRSGAVLGAAAEVDGMVAQFVDQYAGLKILITGGDMPLLLRHLRTPLPHDSNLLFKGLNAILNYHVPYVG